MTIYWIWLSTEIWNNAMKIHSWNVVNDEVWYRTINHQWMFFGGFSGFCSVLLSHSTFPVTSVFDSHRFHNCLQKEFTQTKLPISEIRYHIQSRAHIFILQFNKIHNKNSLQHFSLFYPVYMSMNSEQSITILLLIILIVRPQWVKIKRMAHGIYLTWQIININHKASRVLWTNVLLVYKTRRKKTMNQKKRISFSNKLSYDLAMPQWH